MTKCSFHPQELIMLLTNAITAIDNNRPKAIREVAVARKNKKGFLWFGKSKKTIEQHIEDIEKELKSYDIFEGEDDIAHIHINYDNDKYYFNKVIIYLKNLNPVDVYFDSKDLIDLTYWVELYNKDKQNG